MHSIRAATLLDSKFIQAIFSETISCAQWLPTESRLKVDFAQASEGETLFVCCNCENEVLGFVSVYEPDYFIHHLYVARRCQRQGIGAALLKFLEAYMLKPWHLKCLAQNEMGLEFYLSQGWIEEGRAEGPDGPYVLFKKF